MRLNAKEEHKKYILAMVAGALVTAVLFGVVVFFIGTVNKFDDTKKEIVSFSYDVLKDKSVVCEQQLSNCAHDNEMLLKAIDSIIVNNNLKLNRYKNRITKLKSNIDSLINQEISHNENTYN
jgi:uncharacterized membrane protein required for colicin V production